MYKRIQTYINIYNYI